MCIYLALGTAKESDATVYKLLEIVDKRVRKLYDERKRIDPYDRFLYFEIQEKEEEKFEDLNINGFRDY